MRELTQSILKGYVKSLTITLLICISISVLMLFADFSDDLLSYISIVLLGFICYMTAFSSTQIKRTKGLIQGLVSGVTIFAITFVLSFISGNLYFSEMLPVKFIVCIAFGVIGGIKGINTKQTKRYK